jgi:phosphopantothenoylcysteine decarboxylase/phosphopantothenate--cysteine ligase
MGFALAQQLANRGARVILIAGPVKLSVSHPLIQRINVVSAKEMYDKAVQFFASTDCAIMCAAVADFRPLKQEPEKVKRGSGNYTIELTPNPDIAAQLGKMKEQSQILVGFALESQNEIQNARKKIVKKNLDFIVLNSLNDEGAGFQSDTNKISIIDRHNKITNFELKHKDLVAADIVDYIEQLMLL